VEAAKEEKREERSKSGPEEAGVTGIFLIPQGEREALIQDSEGQ
jgi:hypothetical protein